MVKSVVLARSAHGSLAAPALRRCRPRHALTRSERPTPTPRRAPRARRRRRARRARLRAPRRSLARNAALLIRRDERGPLLRAAAGAPPRISFSSLSFFFHRSPSSSRCWGSSAGCSPARSTSSSPSPSTSAPSAATSARPRERATRRRRRRSSVSRGSAAPPRPGCHLASGSASH